MATFNLIVFVLLPLVFDLCLSEETFDHSAQHCHDVSVWGDVEFKDEVCQKCQTQFEQVCEEKREEVCAQVPGTTCRLVPHADCRMYMEETAYNETEVVIDGQYIPWQCSNFTQEEMHVKLVPRCVNVTRQDCVTKWVVTSTGEKVWDGNEQCTPVTWMNCTLHEEPKLFNQTYTRCTRSGIPIPTMQCQLAEKTRMTSGMRCDITSTVDCNCTHTQQCVEIVYQECHEAATPLSCETSQMRVPFQPKIHRVKCLLADETESPELNVEENAEKADQELEGSGEREAI